MATQKAARPPAPQVADSHDLIRVHGARVNNLRDVSIELPKRRLTVFTGVSGSGKSSLVFDTIAAESQRLINETYSAFVQGFMPTLSRPDVDVLEGLTTAIIVDQERMGANPRSTVGTATDANAMLRILFSRLGKPHIGPPTAFSFNVPTRTASGAMTVDKGQGQRIVVRNAVYQGGMCPRCEGMGSVNDFDLTAIYDESSRSPRAASSSRATAWTAGTAESSAAPVFDGQADREVHQEGAADLLYGEPTKIKVEGINLTYEGVLTKVQKSMLSKDLDAMQPHVRAGSSSGRSRSRPVPTATAPGSAGKPARRRSTGRTSPTSARCRSATWPTGSEASTSRRWPRCSPASSTSSTRSRRSAWGTSRSTGRRARCPAARRSAPR